MVTSENEITRRIEERDSERSVRRAQAATVVGQLARRRAELAGQVAELERELGTVLTEAGDVIDAAELAQVTDIPVADLTRWLEDATRSSRSGKRARPRAKTHGASGHRSKAATEPPAARTAAQAPAESAEAAAGAAHS
ncbi:hypothetical protein ACIA5G_52270 [Amycolatopsis sp. NPDC051758]|uniref:hypothetical protein n=1 Tax=Amycolatopsis sp. NPDC051758 TaxID=3363935 RepID=UPI0037AFD373